MCSECFLGLFIFEFEDFFGWDIYIWGFLRVFAELISIFYICHLCLKRDFSNDRICFFSRRCLLCFIFEALD